MLTDELLKLKESIQFRNLSSEIEARWRLVETAWSLKVNRSILRVQHDPETDSLFVEEQKMRRIAITSTRDALNGYQKGKCFYCFADISVNDKQDSGAIPEVDHFFAHTLRTLDSTTFSDDLNGIWNLVLACRNCNRGANGKFSKVPRTRYLSRLHTRNSYLINSHHPLRETLVNQTGRNENERASFLQRKYEFAKDHLLFEWQPENEREAVF